MGQKNLFKNMWKKRLRVKLINKQKKIGNLPKKELLSLSSKEIEILSKKFQLHVLISDKKF
jgi:hypothetical protein